MQNHCQNMWGLDMKRSALVTTAIGAAFAAALGAASPAMALEGKQCLPMAQMNEALRAEGQRTMIIGDRMAVNDDSTRSSGVSVTRYVNTVTSNADGSLGYQLEGDLPRAQTSTNVCVRAKLTDVHLYDPQKPTIPATAMLGGQFDAVVRGNAAKGTRPMVVANTVRSNGQGTGLPFVMFGNAEDRSASIQTKMPNGQPQFLVLMGDTDYTAAGRARLSTEVAMLDPK
jgi:hypothetical protein